MQQYYVKQQVHVNENILMDSEQSHHIKHVMRMKDGEVIRIADCDASLFYATIKYIRDEVYTIIQSIIEDDTKNVVKITLLQCLIKKEKWDFLLQKCCELGVDVIVPFTSSRCVVKALDERQDKKMQRWDKLLLEASRQCKRSTLVELKQTRSMKEALLHKSELNLIAYEDADASSEQLYTILKANPSVKSVSIAIGCEGGFSQDEVLQFMEQGYHRISLGNRILRAETAAMASVNAISFFYEMEGNQR